MVPCVSIQLTFLKLVHRGLPSYAERNKSMFIFASLSNSYATALASCASVLAIKVGALNLLTVRRYICVILELHMLAFDLLKLLRPAWRTL